jgi:hypothetical protein
MMQHDWVDEIKARGLAAPVRVLLDALAPLGPVGAQVLWMAQPVAGLWGGRQWIGQLAETLEQPGGVEELCRLLDEEG